MAEPKFNDGVAESIWEEIRTNGMYGRSKNDFYDFVLYTLNKHDPDHFLDENDNATNERLLKISATRIKAAKKNISVKFMDDGEYDQIFCDFIKKISDGGVPSLNDSSDGLSYTMVIEDIALRSIIEGKLKRLTGTTLDYHLNTELVTIGHEAFIRMLGAETEYADPDVKKMLESMVGGMKAGELKKDAVDLIKGITESYEPKNLTTAILKEVAKFVHKRIARALSAK